MTTALIGACIGLCYLAGWALTQWGEEMERQAKQPQPEPENKPSGYVTMTDPDGVRIKIERPTNQHPEMQDPWE